MIKRLGASALLVVFLVGVFAAFGGSFKLLLPLLPAFVAIISAYVFREVLISLFIGISVGSYIMLSKDSGHGLVTAGRGFLHTIDHYIVESIADKDHVSIIVFTLFIGGLVHLIAKSGGVHAIVKKISPLAKNSIWAQFFTWLLGLVIFFDDYANTLIVGNSMRPVTDRYRISREKLSFIVDATAAPVSSLVLISTWIGYEIGLIQDVIKDKGLDVDAYSVFIASIPFRFYIILMLIFIPFLIIMNRDLFSMKKAEERARTTGEVLREGSTLLAEEKSESKEHPGGLWHALVPLVVLIGGVVVGLFVTGYRSTEVHTLQSILGSSDSYKSLMWASFVASLSSMGLILFYKIMPMTKVMYHWIQGLKSMINAVVVLTLAWGIGLVLKDLKAADSVVQVLSGNIDLRLLPIITFFVAAVVAFATGTSWGCMAILFPIALPVAFEVQGIEQLPLIYATTGAILSGAVFGDHCSPISDTTIMSSIASQVDHMDHVSTQLPYALLVMIIAVAIGYIPSGFGMNPWIANIIGLILLVLVIRFFGAKQKVISIED